MKPILVLSMLLLITSSSCTVTANLAGSPGLPTPDAAVTAEPTGTATRLAAATPFETPSPETGAVCFGGNLDSGTLRVRACPGLACSEVGFLVYGEKVSTNNEYEEKDGSTWLRLLSPIEGWANSRYICEPEVNP
jgi:hypothetical protein